MLDRQRSEKQQSGHQGRRKRGRRHSRHQSKYFPAAHEEDHSGAGILLQLMEEHHKPIFTLQPLEDPTLEQLGIS